MSRPVLLPLLWLAASVPAVAAGLPDDPLRALDAMSRHVRTLDYSGVFTYQFDREVRTARIAHVVKGGLENERLLHLDGEPAEVVRRGHPVDCEHEGDRLLRLPALAAGEAAAGVGTWYAVHFEGTERIASRTGKRLRIAPRDSYRYGRTLVLDEQSALLLKSETTDGLGNVLERFQFVDVSVGGAQPAEQLAAAGTAAHRIPAHAVQTAATQPVAPPAFGWQAAWLPEGFALTGRELRGNAGRVQAETYSDGLSVFAVFVEPRDSTQDESAGFASQGATISYTIPRGSAHRVTVVGEVPAQTAQLVANSVNFDADTH